MTVSVRITHKVTKDIGLLKKGYAKSFLPCRDRKLNCALIKHLNVEKWGPHLSNRGSRTYMERVATCLLLFVFKNTYHVHEQPIYVIQTWRNKRYTYKDDFKENADAFVRRMQIESENVSGPF